MAKGAISQGPSQSSKPHGECGKVDRALVGQCGCVVAGGDGSGLLASVEAAFDYVALSICSGVEEGWPATGPTAAPAVGLLIGVCSGIVGRAAPLPQIPRIARDEKSWSASTRRGRVHGRPRTGRGIRMPVRTWMNIMQSLRCRR